MLVLCVIIPLIMAAAVSSILIYLIGMSAVSAFIVGAGICILLGWLIGKVWGDDLFFSITGWIAAGYMFIAWIIALCFNYYAG